MSVRMLRVGLAGALVLLAAVGLGFHQLQNSGNAPVGGPISVPKALWLVYAVAAWFVVPPFLWRDARLQPGVRRLFGAFWAWMLCRGGAELVMLYYFVHWNPLYGVACNVGAGLLLVALRRGLKTESVLDRRALRYSGTLSAGLLIETAFALMFYQTGAHTGAVYFASAEASWGFINLVTWVALCFVYPDLLAALVCLYFPGWDRSLPRFLVWARKAAQVGAVGTVLAALAFYTHMMQVEYEGARFQRVGYEIVDSCVRFKDAFSKGDEPAMADFILGGEATWLREPVRHPYPFELKRWRDGGTRQSLRDFVFSWRRGLPEVRQAAFKIHLVDEVAGDRDAVAQVRFEVTGRGTTDAGILRCRFRKGDDDRWRVTASSLVEGSSVAGPGNHFVDLARERGLNFVLEPDERLLPGACNASPDGIKLKFQTMRHAYGGCATADFDGDGHDDVFLCSGGRPALFRNKGDGTFEDVTERAGLGHLRHVNTAVFADVNNDGYPDLFCASFFENCYLFRNNGDGTFTDVTASSGLRQLGMVTCACFLDYDRDGRLDLYLGRFLDSRKAIPDSFLYTRNGEPNVLYRNDGDFHFTDVTAAAGVGDVGLTLSVNAADYDGDGWQDLFVANDFGRSVLFKNMGDGTFKDVSKESGCLAIGGNMSATWGDFLNEGRLGLYVAAIRSNQRWFVQPITARRVLFKYIREGRLLYTNPLFQDLKAHLGEDWVNIGNHALAGNYLFRQGADGQFTNVAEQAGARPAGWYWSSGFFDIHNDGWLGIYATDGWISGKDPHDL